MLFNSFEFILFFIAVSAVYYVLPHALRLYLLLGASYYFYSAWRPEYLVLIFASTIIDFFVAQAIFRSTSIGKRRLLLATSLVGNLGLLFVFKYLDFFLTVIQETLGLFGLNCAIEKPQLVLPVGISFYTFQTLSYTIEVFRNRVKPTTHLAHFALYVAFFPQLVAGPIERPGNLLHQLIQRVKPEFPRITSGLKLMLWGLFKKVVVADRLAILVDNVYGSPDLYNGSYFVIATVFFAFQIMCDFSGYSDIAIGAARVLGIELMLNFNRPYAARTFTDFWRRWHISLSTWFRDYVYIPLGGSKTGHGVHLRNILIVFVVSGLWHGANYTFLTWGLLHGLYLSAELLLKPATTKLRARFSTLRMEVAWNVLAWGTVFSLTLLAWVFFRAESVPDAFYVLEKMVFELSSDFSTKIPRFSTVEMFIALAMLGVVEWIQYCERQNLKGDLFGEFPLLVRWSILAFLVFAITLFGVAGEAEFIYFQF